MRFVVSVYWNIAAQSENWHKNRNITKYSLVLMHPLRPNGSFLAYKESSSLAYSCGLVGEEEQPNTCEWRKVATGSRATTSEERIRLVMKMSSSLLVALETNCECPLYLEFLKEFYAGGVEG